MEHAESPFKGVRSGMKKAARKGRLSGTRNGIAPAAKVVYEVGISTTGDVPMCTRKRLLALTVAGTLLFAASSSALGGSLDRFSDALESLADMARSADRAHEAFEDAMRNGRDYGRYDREWRDYESRLERERVRVMARIADVDESRIRELRRDGHGWDSIARRYHFDPRRFGYGLSRYDHERDGWRGTPPGLAKKGGLPPGQAKKFKKHKQYDD